MQLNKYLVKQLGEGYINQVLKFMVLGAIEFIKNTDMTPPKSLEEDMNNYLKKINPAQSFIGDKFIKSVNPKDRILMGDIYDIYKKWAIDNGLTIFVKKTDFYKTINEQIGEAVKIGGKYYYKNLVEIIDEEEEETDNFIDL